MQDLIKIRIAYGILRASISNKSLQRNGIFHLTHDFKDNL